MTDRYPYSSVCLTCSTHFVTEQDEARHLAATGHRRYDVVEWTDDPDAEEGTTPTR